MDLTRYWRARSDGRDIEVQWTGFRFTGGWTLRLLVDGKLKDESKVMRFARDFQLKDGSITVHFWGFMFCHRCKITAADKVLTDSSQPWNVLALTIIASAAVIPAVLIVIANALER